MDIISFGAVCGAIAGVFWLITDSRSPTNDDSGSWSDGIWDALTKK